MINVLTKIYLVRKVFISLILTFHSLSLREDGRNSGQEPGCKDHEGMLLVGLLLKAGSACSFIHCRISNQENVPQTCPQSNLTETVFPLKFSLPSWNWCVSNLTRLSASKPGIQFLNSFYRWLRGALWVLGVEPDSFKRSWCSYPVPNFISQYWNLTPFLSCKNWL